MFFKKYKFLLIFLFLFPTLTYANTSIETPIKFLVNALNEIKHPKALAVASELIKNTQEENTYNLIIRKSELDVYDIKRIADAISKIKKWNGPDLITLSMSFNENIKDDGLKLILDAVPDTIKVLACVECGLRDNAALEIIDYAYKNRNINEIYLEGNFFSESIQNKFDKLRFKKPNLTIISQWPSQDFKKMVKKNFK